MVEENDLLVLRREVERIKDRIDDISHIQAQQVKADGRVKASIMEYFSGKGSDTKIRLYLAVDGKTSLSGLASKAQIAKGTASPLCKEMYENGLLSFDDVRGEKVYQKSTIDKAIGLSKELMRRGNGSSAAS